MTHVTYIHPIKSDKCFERGQKVSTQVLVRQVRIQDDPSLKKIEKLDTYLFIAHLLKHALTQFFFETNVK